MKWFRKAFFVIPMAGVGMLFYMVGENWYGPHGGVLGVVVYLAMMLVTPLVDFFTKMSRKRRMND